MPCRHVRITHDTAEFAVSAIRTWLEKIGRQRYPKAQELTITADCGGSNGARVRLWKVELQKFADDTGLAIKVRHYPPGTSKWNKIEHRMFCHITQNWRRNACAMGLEDNTENNQTCSSIGALDIVARQGALFRERANPTGRITLYLQRRDRRGFAIEGHLV